MVFSGVLMIVSLVYWYFSLGAISGWTLIIFSFWISVLRLLLLVIS